ncbi:IS630 family transposase [Egbenema bharatensis]|uniref:IS630 family transposase n=1 Tax=Egbenema bharatensis TaxID=3463334 RepID=UPI003A85A9F4
MQLVRAEVTLGLTTFNLLIVLMLPPLYVRPLSETEQTALEQGLRSKNAFTLRRCQILLASARGTQAREIAAAVGCSVQTVRNTIRAFHQQGLACLQAQSSRPKTVKPIFDQDKRAQLHQLLHANPRHYGKSRSTWTLDLLAEVAHEQGLTEHQVSRTTIEEALKAMGISWRRAKAWIVSPDEQYELKKRQRDRLIQMSEQNPDWVVGFLDEVWWSRLRDPMMHSWSEEGQPLQLVEKTADKAETEPKAIACYGIYLRAEAQMLLRFVEQRPVSEITCQFLEWVTAQVSEMGKRVMPLVWDNASWHVSKQVQQWIKQHNAQVKQTGKGVRLIVCQLPVKSPWLNAIEPKWIHAKRAIVEPQQKLSVQELKTRVCDWFECPLLEPLAKKVS